MQKRGYFISFSGLNGAGKSSTIDTVYNILNEQGVKVHKLKLLTSEILNNKDFIHHYDKISENEKLHLKELQLMVNSKIQENKNIILPALLSGETVLYDRYIDSSIEHHLRNKTIKSLEVFSRVGDLIKPDLALYLKIPPEESIERVKKRNIRVSPWELDMHNVKNSYDEYEKLTRVLDYIVIDNYNNSPKECVNQVLEHIKNCTPDKIVTYKEHLKNKAKTINVDNSSERAIINLY
jgi:dTMP kinase